MSDHKSPTDPKNLRAKRASDTQSHQPGEFVERRAVKRFTNPELRNSVQQTSLLLNGLSISLLILLSTQAIMCYRTPAYVPRGVFFCAVTGMGLFQITRYKAAIRRYLRGESEGSVVAIYTEQKNFIMMLTFLMGFLSLVFLVLTL